MTDELETKYRKLKTYLKDLGSVAVAFSGGVDSTLLLWAAHEVLGDQAIAITCSAASVPERELSEAMEFCKANGIKQEVIRSDQMQIPGFRENPENRCYICKKAIFTEIRNAAEKYGILHVTEGSNMDDMDDYRPGMKAIEELQVKSPLREADLTKNEIREISKEKHLPTWEKPAYACLATRFPYGDEITEEKLRMVEQGENLLIQLGLPEMRVRIHGKMARIEVLPEEMEKLMAHREEIVREFKSYGFSYVSMDLQGYRLGAMNETIRKR